MGVSQKIGRLGEELAGKFLMKRGYKIVDRNYRRPWGELDIIAERKGKIHFIEVKSMSGHVGTKDGYKNSGVNTPKSVTRETLRGEALDYIKSDVKKDNFRAEDHMSFLKIKRLGRIIQTYLFHRHVSDETEWQCDVATVLVDVERKTARINIIEDILLGVHKGHF